MIDRLSRIVCRLARWMGVDLAALAQLAAVTGQVDDSSGWTRYSAAPNERDQSEIFRQYADALEAWRKNPLAKRIVDITTDYCLGDGLRPTATGQLGNWLDRWWLHPKNHMPTRMPELSDELARAGDLFITLHRNPDDGISYVRPIPKDRIVEIETLPNDWETETAFVEITAGMEQRRWLSPAHPAAAESDALMVHYAVNRVVGALIGESDLGAIIPWLLRYSRIVEDRVRLHWASRLFLWMVTVPANLVQAKREQYNQPPAAGSVIVKDSQESWEPVTPNLHAFDARYDLQVVRGMIDAGSGYPPHWRGEATDVNLATATAMERAASRHLRRRQLALEEIIRDLAFTAYSRAHAVGAARPRPSRLDIRVEAPDLSRQDNADLAAAAGGITRALAELVDLLPRTSPRLAERALRMFATFAGEELTPEEVQEILAELAAMGDGAPAR